MTQHVAGFLPTMLFGRQTLLAQGVDINVRLSYAAVQNLVYGCGNVPQNTVESSDTPPTHCDQHVQQSIDIPTQLPAGLQCDPVQMAEDVQQEYVLVGGAWLHPSGLSQELKFEIEKFYPGPGIEPWPLALRASALTTTLSRTNADPCGLGLSPGPG